MHRLFSSYLPGAPVRFWFEFLLEGRFEFLTIDIKTDRLTAVRAYVNCNTRICRPQKIAICEGGSALVRNSGFPFLRVPKDYKLCLFLAIVILSSR